MEVSVLDASSGKILQTIRGEELRGHLYPNTRLAISPDDRFLVTLLDGQHDLGIVIDDEIQTEPLIGVSVWELGTGRLMARQVTAKNVRALAFCPDSNSFAVADTDGGVEIWLVSKFIQEHAPDESPTNP
jgi:WD40 repeat protein